MSAAPVLIIIRNRPRTNNQTQDETVSVVAVPNETAAETLRRAAAQLEANEHGPGNPNS